jgi:hypothetical protein
MPDLGAFVGLAAGARNDRGGEGMRALLALGLFGLMALMAGCVPPPAPPINSLAFERRPPPPGQPGYLETIKYVDDGMRYIVPNAGFFVSGAGEMCFLAPLTPGYSLELSPQNYWCVSPFAVGTVAALRNDATYVNTVQLWCRHAAPQCAHKIAYPNMFDTMTVANSITAETIPFERQRDAVEYLVYLMGGDAGSGGGWAPGAPIPLDSGAPQASVRPQTLVTEETR